MTTAENSDTHVNSALAHGDRTLTFLVGLAGIGVPAAFGVSLGDRYPFWSIVQTGLPWTFSLFLTVAVPIAATIVGLCLHRQWPYLLVAAPLLALPQAVELLSASATPGQLVRDLALAAGPLAVLGVLGAAQRLIRDGSTGRGAALAGILAAAPLLAAAALGQVWAPVLSQPQWSLGLVVLALVGAGLVVYGLVERRRGAPRPVLQPDVLGTGEKWGPNVAVAGIIAAFLGLIPVVLTIDRISSLLNLQGGVLYRHEATFAELVGLTVLVLAAILGAVAGARAIAATLISAATLIAVLPPVALVLAALSGSKTLDFGAGLLGLALGAAAGLSRFRSAFAAAGAFLTALILFVLNEATDSDPAKIADQRLIIPAALLLILLSATVTATVASVAPPLVRRRALPAVLGPITAGVVLGGIPALNTFTSSDVGFAADYKIPQSAVEFLAVAVLLGAVALLSGLHRRPVEPAQATVPGPGVPGPIVPGPVAPARIDPGPVDLA